MLQQLARLTRPVSIAGETVLALAVYADEHDWPLDARDCGLEGVACVDDAARAVVLMDDLRARTGIALFDAWGRGFLDFVLAMRRGNGTFANFILDWTGTPNESGPTSRPGGSYWQARALRALARGSERGDARAFEAYVETRAAIGRQAVPPKVRAIHMLDSLEALHRGDDRATRRAELERWSDEIAACARKGVLLDEEEGDGAPRLWGRLQEAVLARAGRALGRPGLVALALRSAERVVVPAVMAGFERDAIEPYGVACSIETMESLHAVTGEPRYRMLAVRARSWFSRRNADGRTAFDRSRGRASDGRSGGRLSDHSGAESNILAAQALIDEVVETIRRQPGVLAETTRLLQSNAPGVVVVGAEHSDLRMEMSS